MNDIAKNILFGCAFIVLIPVWFPTALVFVVFAAVNKLGKHIREELCEVFKELTTLSKKHGKQE